MKISLAVQPKHSQRVYFPTTDSFVTETHSRWSFAWFVKLWILSLTSWWIGVTELLSAWRLVSPSSSGFYPAPKTQSQLLVWECQEAGALDKRAGVKLASLAKPALRNFECLPDTLVEQEVWLEPSTWGERSREVTDITSCEQDIMCYSFLKEYFTQKW